MTRILLALALLLAALPAAARDKPVAEAKLLPFMEQTNIHAPTGPAPQAPRPRHIRR